ncbi:MAG: carboxypeptidase regulatory-like domain-containing protein [Bacteroidales bacterium]|nr:carboxypeptidase regulatory-like domain-containing protein [Bacteroidales bacterium]
MKHWTTLLLFAVLSVSAFAQRHVNGIVTDGNSNKPIAGATVSSGSESVRTAADGSFFLGNLPDKGKITLSISAANYESGVFNVRDLEGGQYKLKESANTPASDNASLELDSDEDMGYGGQTVAGLQTQSQDVFDRNAGYNLGFAYFKARGYDNRYNNVYVNGALMNDPESGRASWSEWGGLNDAVRNKEAVSGLNPSNFGAGNIGGEQNINMRASAIAKQHKVTYSITNRTYTQRLMYTYGSGVLPSGWAVALSVSARLGDGLVYNPNTKVRVPGFTDKYTQKLVDNGGTPDGLMYASLGYYFSLEKRFRQSGHALSFVAFGAPTKRATQGGSYQEVYDLVGTNYYNGNWGYQDGKIRSARIRQMFLPTFQLVWDYDKDNTQVTTTASYQFGRYGTTSLNWYDAADPRPDYYRYLPSYYEDPATADMVAELWRNDPSKSQINWDGLYEVNYIQKAQGKQSKYVVEDRRNDVNDFDISSVMNHRFTDQIKLNAGARVRNSITHNFKTIDDLLGGNYWLDIDQFAERDFSSDADEIQNDLDHPNRIVKEGDIYGYNYDMHLVYEQLFALAKFELAHWDLYAGAELSNSNFWRYGKMRNGRAPNNSKGKGDVHSFFNYGVKAGATWKINGRNYLYANVAWKTRAPYIRDAYVSPRVKDVVASNLQNEKIFSVDLNYVLQTPVVSGRLTLYHTMFFDGMESFSFYHDDYRTFVNYTLNNVNQTHQGIELGLDVKIMPQLSATLVGNVGNYRYTNNPTATISAENGAFEDQTNTIYYKNYRVTGTPQLAGSLGLNYQAPFSIFINANVNYAAWNYLSMNPERRSQAAIEGVSQDNGELLHAILDEERLTGGWTLDISVGKIFRFKGCQLNLNASVQNCTNNRNIRTGGYEQRRFDYYEHNVDKYPPRYFYAYGTTFFINASIRF